MEEIVLIVFAFLGMTLTVLNVIAQNAKRTVNKLSRELLDTGEINSGETSEIGTIYSNPFSDWCLEIDNDNQFLILRNQRVSNSYTGLEALLLHPVLMYFTLSGLCNISVHRLAWIR